MVQLGQEFAAQTPTRDQLVFQSDIDRLVTRVTADLERRLQQYINGRMPSAPRDPVVNVTVPVPSVANAFTPTFSPRFEPQIDVTTDIPGFDKLVSEMAQLRVALSDHMRMMSRPVTRIVHRDEDGLIDKIVETR